MNAYIGKSCPFCKAPFLAYDEIVICSSCDMPHHKDCWIENQGCTTFGCMGTMKAAESAVTSVTATQLVYEDAPSPSGSVFCPRCGARRTVNAAFCGRCGAQAEASAIDPQSALHKDIPRLAGAGCEYYMARFQAMLSQNRRDSWNWMAFLFPGFWSVYRKMYLYGAGILLLSLGLSFLQIPGLLLLIAGSVVYGFFANTLYLHHLEGQVSQLGATPEPYRTQLILQRGGVNITATVLSAVGYVLVLLITILL